MTILKPSKTTSPPNKLFDYDCVTLYLPPRPLQTMLVILLEIKGVQPSVMQSDGNSFYGDVIRGSVNMAERQHLIPKI